MAGSVRAAAPPHVSAALSAREVSADDVAEEMAQIADALRAEANDPSTR